MLGVGKIAEEFMNQYPEYYITWFEHLLESEDYDRIIQEANSVLERMNKRFILRARIVEIKHKSGKPLSLIDEVPKRIAIDEREFGILQFLNGDFDEVYNKCLKDKEALGWSSSYKGALLPLYLLMLDADKELSELQKSVIGQYTYRYTKGMKQVPSQIIEECFKIWKEQVKLSGRAYEKYYKWCVEEVDKRLIAIVSNTFRNAYKRAATLVVLLDGIEKDENRGEFVRKYQAMFPRHRAFREEIKRLIENK